MPEQQKQKNGNIERLTQILPRDAVGPLFFKAGSVPAPPLHVMARQWLALCVICVNKWTRRLLTVALIDSVDWCHPNFDRCLPPTKKKWIGVVLGAELVTFAILSSTMPKFGVMTASRLLLLLVCSKFLAFILIHTHCCCMLLTCSLMVHLLWLLRRSWVVILLFAIRFLHIFYNTPHSTPPPTGHWNALGHIGNAYATLARDTAKQPDSQAGSQLRRQQAVNQANSKTLKCWQSTNKKQQQNSNNCEVNSAVSSIWVAKNAHTWWRGAAVGLCGCSASVTAVQCEPRTASVATTAHQLCAGDERVQFELKNRFESRILCIRIFVKESSNRIRNISIRKAKLRVSTCRSCKTKK